MFSCPICGNKDMVASDIQVSMTDIIKEWEAILKDKFPLSVRDHYAKYGDRPIVLHKCGQCEFGQFHPIISGTAGFYDAIVETDYYNDDKWEFKMAANEIMKYGSTRVLDVGAGSGIFLEYLRSQNNTLDLNGFELSEALTKKLKENGFGTIAANGENIKYPEADFERFDVICMLQVLEHVDDPSEFVDRFLPYLADDGLLIITTPNAAGPIKSFPKALTEVPPHHTTRWTDRTFAALLDAKKLTMKSVLLEPLPEYLFNSYLPIVWQDSPWPAKIFDPIAKSRGLNDLNERVSFAASQMREAGIKWLEDIPGHTIFVSAVLQRNN